MANFFKKLIEAYMHPIYKGTIYPTIGFKSSFTSRNIEIEFTKYIEIFGFTTVFHLKNKVKNPDFRYNIDALKYYDPLSKGYKIELTSYIFDKNEHIDVVNVTDYDQIEPYFIAHPGNVGRFCTMTFRSQNGKYIGDITTLFWLLRSNISSPDIAENGDNTCSIGAYINPKTKELEGYVGWSHRASQLFRIGDAIYDPEVPLKLLNLKFRKMKEYKKWENIEQVPYRYRGRHTCLILDDCKKAAINFANDVG